MLLIWTNSFHCCNLNIKYYFLKKNLSYVNLSQYMCMQWLTVGNWNCKYRLQTKNVWNKSWISLLYQANFVWCLPLQISWPCTHSCILTCTNSIIITRYWIRLMWYHFLPCRSLQHVQTPEADPRRTWGPHTGSGGPHQADRDGGGQKPQRRQCKSIWRSSNTPHPNSRPAI